MPVLTAAQTDQVDPASLWEDFNHYTIIARPELARDAARALLDEVDNTQLLDVIESSDYTDYEANLIRAHKIELLGKVASELERRIQEARIERSRDSDRMIRDIQQLGEGKRPYNNAVERLRAAGQYAAPPLLDALQDDRQSKLHPYIVKAMVAVGQPIVMPLCEALLQLEQPTMAQVAQVLAEIGYPHSLPYLKQALEDEKLAPKTRQIIDVAYHKILQNANITESLSAAELFTLFGQAIYQGTTSGKDLPGYDAAQKLGMLWQYSPRMGLIPIPIHQAIYGDVLAMQAAENALKLNPEMDPALSLYLMANLRRENKLPEGEVDPSYPADMKPPMFCAMLAGPLRLHDVLNQALNDEDPALALDAIHALRQTAGTDALVNRNAAKQPLIRCLTYPDRRVRFSAAAALAHVRPDQSFDEASRVVPVLAETVRQSHVKYAMVLADDRNMTNQLIAALTELGFEAFGDTSLAQVSTQIRNRPGIDLIVAKKNIAEIQSLVKDTAYDYKLAAVPIIALMQGGDQIRLSDMYTGNRRVISIAHTTDPSVMSNAVEYALSSTGHGHFTDEESTLYALTALSLLEDIAKCSRIYNVTDALPALIMALEDNRQEVVVATGNVLAVINHSDSQQSIAAAALAESGRLQLELLADLADSATYFGNMLEQRTTDQLLQLVESPDNELAVAAARAHGALTLPTSNAVQMIVE